MSKLPATAGNFLTEQELRAYTKCSKYYSYGGLEMPSVKSQVIEYAYERLIISYLRNKVYDPLDTLNKYLHKGVKHLASSYLEQQRMEIIRHGFVAINDILTIMPMDLYVPVMGPYEYVLKVSKTPVKLKVSASFRSKKNQTLHLVCFSPYTTQHNMQNDPANYLKLALLKNSTKEHNKRTQVRLHLFSVLPSNEVVYTSVDTDDLSKEAIGSIHGVVESIEAGRAYPVLPCNYNCEFKRKCKP